jgi:hypothetical protein
VVNHGFLYHGEHVIAEVVLKIGGLRQHRRELLQAFEIFLFIFGQYCVYLEQCRLDMFFQ